MITFAVAGILVIDADRHLRVMLAVAGRLPLAGSARRKHGTAEVVFDACRFAKCGVATAVEFDEMQREIDARRHPATGHHIAVVDDARLRMHVHAVVSEILERGAVSDRRPAAKDAAGRDQHGAGADSGDAGARRVQIREWPRG